MSNKFPGGQASGPPGEQRREGKGKGRGEDGEGRNWSPPLFRPKLRPCILYLAELDAMDWNGCASKYTQYDGLDWTGGLDWIS
jgi:hypothetical protein